MRAYQTTLLSLFIAILLSLSLTSSPAMALRQIETVDSYGNVGRNTSLAFDSSGNPAISYNYYNYSSKSTELKFAHYNGESWDITTVDSEGSVGRDTSLAFDASDNPAISYFDWTNKDLKYAYFNGSAWDITTVDSSGRVGESTSLAFDTSGLPAMSYYDTTNGDLKYAHFNGTKWKITTVDSEGRVGFFTSLAFDSSGNPSISYIGDSINALKYASFNGSSWDITNIAGLWGMTSLAFNPISGYPAISCGRRNLNYAYFNGESWNITTVDSDGYYNSLAFDPSGNPAISYRFLGSLKYALFNGVSWYTTMVDTDGRVGVDNSLAFNPLTGEPAISYYSGNYNNDLKYATSFRPDKVCKCPKGGLKGCISGRVTNRKGLTLLGKTVVAKRIFPTEPRVKKRVVTDEDGCYTFRKLEDGTYKIRVKDCKARRKIVVIEGGTKVNRKNFRCK
jgi:hypothetical protein